MMKQYSNEQEVTPTNTRQAKGMMRMLSPRSRNHVVEYAVRSGEQEIKGPIVVSEITNYAQTPYKTKLASVPFLNNDLIPLLKSNEDTAFLRDPERIINLLLNSDLVDDKQENRARGTQTEARV